MTTEFCGSENYELSLNAISRADTSGTWCASCPALSEAAMRRRRQRTNGERRRDLRLTHTHKHTLASAGEDSERNTSEMTFGNGCHKLNKR